MKDRRVRITVEVHGDLKRLAVALTAEMDQPVTVAQVAAVKLGMPISVYEAAKLLDEEPVGAALTPSRHLVVFHDCDHGVEAGRLPFSEGFPQMPWECPLCGGDVEDVEEMSFEFDPPLATPDGVAFEPMRVRFAESSEYQRRDEKGDS